MAADIRDHWQFKKWRALILDQGSPEFIAECVAEFEIGVRLGKRRRDPGVSKHNLEALRSGSLEFIEVTYDC